MVIHDFDGSFSTADIFDSAPNQVLMCDLPFRHFGVRRQFAGRCVTLMASEDPQIIKTTVREPGKNCALVIDGSSIPDCACIGDRLASVALENSWAGFVIAGAVRDIARLRKIPLGILALRTTAKRPFGNGGGGLKGPTLTLGGICIRSNDLLYADEDAVCSLPDVTAGDKLEARGNTLGLLPTLIAGGAGLGKLQTLAELSRGYSEH